MPRKNKKKGISNFDDYAILVAKVRGEKNGSCDRARVGIVIANDNDEILVEGWNTSPKGIKTCDEDGHLMVNGHCNRTIHAEQMAIGLAAKKGISLKNTTAYLTHKPCISCLKLLEASGIKRIVFDIDYKSKDTESAFEYFISNFKMIVEQYKKES